MATSLQNTFCCADIARRLPYGLAAHPPVRGDLIYCGPGSRSPAVIGKRKKATGFAPGMDDNTLNFWRGLCLGAVQVTPIAGNPFSCIETDNAGRIDERLQ
ncbi:hypothetical protein RJ498_002171 [Pluralibacter gergoviae]